MFCRVVLIAFLAGLALMQCWRDNKIILQPGGPQTHDVPELYKICRSTKNCGRSGSLKKTILIFGEFAIKFIPFYLIPSSLPKPVNNISSPLVTTQQPMPSVALFPKSDIHLHSKKPLAGSILPCVRPMSIRT